MTEIKWGIIGCGDVTEKKSGPAFNKVQGSELVAVMRRDAVKAEDYAHRHSVPRWYDDAEKLIADPEVNAIYVATPPDTHAEYAVKAMKAGKPVYVEKPMARNYVECLEMISAAEKHNVSLFVAYYRRALPGFLKVKELIEQGAIGKVQLVSLRLHKNLKPTTGDDLPWRVIPEIAGGGHFVDLAAHQLDFLDFLFGPVSNIQANVANLGKRYEAEDTITASFQFEQGMLGSCSWAFNVPDAAEEDVMEFIGDAGKIVFSCFNVVPVQLYNQSGRNEFTYTNPENIQFNLINKVVGELQGKDECPSTGRSAARTSWVMDEVLSMYYHKERGER